MQATRPPSRIGMGRQSAVSSTPPAASTTAAGATAPQTTPLTGPSGIPLTPSAFQTPGNVSEQQHQQELPAQKGHPAATPVFNISPATAAEQAGPIPSITTSTGASKWKSSAASTSSGPVFSVVSRGNRVTAGNGHTPPPPPAKASSTIARTANRLQGRSTSSTSPSGSSIGLRGQRPTPSTLSSSSSSGPAGRAFGSRIGTGHFGDGSSSTASSTRSCTTPLISNTSCKTVARTLSFDEAADSPKSATPGISSSKSSGAASKAKAGLAGKPAAGAAQGLATAASMDDVDQSIDQLDQLTNSNNSSSDSTTWLSGANNSADGAGAASSNNSPFAGLEQPPAADLLGMPGQHAVADLAAVEALLPSERDAASSQAAAKALLQQLVRSAGSITTAAGLHGDAALAAVLGSTAGAAAHGSGLQDTIKEDQEFEAAQDSGIEGSNSCSSFGGVMLNQAARMLQAGASVQQVRQAVMPALLLQLASLAADSSSSSGAGNSSTPAVAEAAAAAGGDAACAAQVAEAAGLLAAGLQAGLAAAKAAVEGYPASSSGASGDVARGGAAARKSSAVGNLVLLVWSSLLLVVGFVAAAVLSVLEGEAMLGGGVGSTAAGAVGAAGIGFCGVGPGGTYGVAAELCGGLGWQQAGAEMQDWGAAAVQHGRRFGA